LSNSLSTVIKELQQEAMLKLAYRIISYHYCGHRQLPLCPHRYM